MISSHYSIFGVNLHNLKTTEIFSHAISERNVGVGNIGTQIGYLFQAVEISCCECDHEDSVSLSRGNVSSTEIKRLTGHSVTLKLYHCCIEARWFNCFAETHGNLASVNIQSEVFKSWMSGVWCEIVHLLLNRNDTVS